MSEVHPALAAARNSWRCAEARDKEGWLALMADDVCIEDPIGVAVTNPSGKGMRGKAEVGEFFDKHIAPSTIVVETHESRVAGNESAHVLTLNTTLSSPALQDQDHIAREFRFLTMLRATLLAGCVIAVESE